MPSPLDVVVVRMPDLTLVAGQSVGLLAGTEVIGKVLAAENKVTASVAIGGNNTPVVDIRGYGLFALWVPATFDGSVISVWVSHDGVTVFPLYDITGAQVFVGSGTVVASRAYDLPGELAPWPYVLFSCNTAQGGTTTDFVLVMRTG